MTTTRCRGQVYLENMPAEVQALGSAWASLMGAVKGLTPELEKDFRFGQCVIRLGDKYRMGGNLKGGTSTMWYPSNETEFRAYEGWRAIEAIPRRENPVAFEALHEFLRRHAIELRAGRSGAAGERVGEALRGRGFIFDVLLAVLGALPRAHLGRRELAGIQLGGWGPDAAKGSAYESGWVLLYDFALEGARRTFLGLLLHELGHAQEAAFDETRRARLRVMHQELTDGMTFLGVEFLLDGDTRRVLQQFAFGEFLAETYMVYVSQGGRLRSFIASLEGPRREAWNVVYDIYREAFEGLEYA